MNTTNTTAPTIGPATAALLRSLRAVETAEGELFDAYVAEFGEQGAKPLFEQDAPLFQPLRERLKFLINENVWSWTTGRDASEPL